MVTYLLIQKHEMTKRRLPATYFMVLYQQVGYLFESRARLPFQKFLKIFLKISSKKYFQKFPQKNIFKNFFKKIFSKISSKNIFKNFLKKFPQKYFQKFPQNVFFAFALSVTFILVLQCAQHFGYCKIPELP